MRLHGFGATTILLGGTPGAFAIAALSYYTVEAWIRGTKDNASRHDWHREAFPIMAILWLTPSAVLEATLRSVIERFARELGTPSFAPHVTLAGGWPDVGFDRLSSLCHA